MFTENWRFHDAEEMIEKQIREVERDEEYVRWATPEGDFWMPAGDGQLIAFLIAEQQRHMYGDPPCGAGDVVLDCGAHVGLFTREALRAGAGLVVAVEPAPQKTECLRRNFAKEIAAGRVIVYAKGVWDRDDVLLLEQNRRNSGADRVTTESFSDHAIRVPLTTIDKMVAELGLSSVDMIKMDIEGAERKALAGASETLAKYKPKLAISTYHLKDDPVVIPEVIRAAQDTYKISCSFCFRSAETSRISPMLLEFE